MKMVAVICSVLLMFSCKKKLENDLPLYDPQLSVEMYLEENSRLKCLVTESLPYSSSTINKMINNATVLFSDGTMTDTLKRTEIYDYESGRHYNYASMRLFSADEAKTYSLQVTDSLGRTITASTKITVSQAKIDDLIYLKSAETNKYSIGLSFLDDAGINNYYRVVIGKGINNYESAHTDFLLADAAFDGKKYSFTSPADYGKSDTVTIRLYSLLKDHYDYLQSAESARTANYNPFMQPVKVKTNVTGGQGIFTAIVYDERTIVIE